MTPLHWRLAVADWEPPGTDVLVQRLRDGLTPGSVVLLHDGGGDRSQTVAAVYARIPSSSSRAGHSRSRHCRQEADSYRRYGSGHRESTSFTRSCRGCALHTEYAYCVAMSVRQGCSRSWSAVPVRLPAAEGVRADTGGTWPLNIGQVYTTLARLERDGLVRALPEHDGGQRPTRSPMTAGRSWRCGSPARSSQLDRPRDELAIKLALALTTPGVDVRPSCRPSAPRPCATCRSHPAQGVRPTTPATSPGAGPGAMVFRAEAEVRWLDHCESSLIRYSPADNPPRRSGRGGSPMRVLAAAEHASGDPDLLSTVEPEGG